MLYITSPPHLYPFPFSGTILCCIRIVFTFLTQHYRLENEYNETDTVYLCVTRSVKWHSTIRFSLNRISRSAKWNDLSVFHAVLCVKVLRATSAQDQVHCDHWCNRNCQHQHNTITLTLFVHPSGLPFHIHYVHLVLIFPWNEKNNRKYNILI